MFAELLKRIRALEGVVLCAIRKWWRPITCVWLSLTMLVHGVVLPFWRFIQTGEMSTDLMALSALVTAVTAAFAVREWGKAQGND